jgi:hypothetical protein
MKIKACGLLAVLVLLLACTNLDASAIATLTLQSQPGDFIGQGGTFNEVYPQQGDENPVITPSLGPRVDGLPAWVFFSLGGTSNVTDLYAIVNIATNELGVPLEPGTYLNAQRTFDATPGHPGLYIAFESRGCDSVTGSFTITDAVYAIDGTVSSLAFSFEQHCEGETPALFGTFTYNANGATPVPEPAGYALVGIGVLGLIFRRLYYAGSTSRRVFQKTQTTPPPAPRSRRATCSIVSNDGALIPRLKPS